MAAAHPAMVGDQQRPRGRTGTDSTHRGTHETTHTRPTTGLRGQLMREGVMQQLIADRCDGLALAPLAPGYGFTPEQVRAMLGGEFPYARGFDWGAVHHFRLEAGRFEPYDGDEILPGPGFDVTVKVDEHFFD